MITCIIAIVSFAAIIFLLGYYLYSKKNLRRESAIVPIKEAQRWSNDVCDLFNSKIKMKERGEEEQSRLIYYKS